jgi:hypothetical protein
LGGRFFLGGSRSGQPDQWLVAPDLAVLWRAYLHRFGLEHTYRFCKQTLNWTTPCVRTPQQADRWTWLVALACTQLRLVRRTIEDVHLQSRLPPRSCDAPVGIGTLAAQPWSLDKDLAP